MISDSYHRSLRFIIDHSYLLVAGCWLQVGMRCRLMLTAGCRDWWLHGEEYARTLINDKASHLRQHRAPHIRKHRPSHLRQHRAPHIRKIERHTYGTIERRTNGNTKRRTYGNIERRTHETKDINDQHVRLPMFPYVPVCATPPLISQLVKVEQTQPIGFVTSTAGLRIQNQIRSYH